MNSMSWNLAIGCHCVVFSVIPAKLQLTQPCVQAGLFSLFIRPLHWMAVVRVEAPGSTRSLEGIKLRRPSSTASKEK